MANFEIPKSPEYSEVLRMLEEKDPATAELFNNMFARLLENEAALLGSKVPIANAKTLDGHGAEYFFPKTGGDVKEITFKTADNGYGRIVKNHDSTNDYGTEFRDYDADGNRVAVILSAKNDNVKFKSKSGNEYSIIHMANIADYTIEKNGGGTVKSTTTIPMGVQNTNTATTLFEFLGKDGRLGLLGFDGADNPIFYDTAHGKHSLIHMGNIGKLDKDVEVSKTSGDSARVKTTTAESSIGLVANSDGSSGLYDYKNSVYLMHKLKDGTLTTDLPIQIPNRITKYLEMATGSEKATFIYGNDQHRVEVGVDTNGNFVAWDYTLNDYVWRIKKDGTREFFGTASENLRLNGGGTIKGTSDTLLALDTSAVQNLLRFAINGVTKGYIGFHDTNPVVKCGSDSFTTLLHTGNIADYAIPKNGGGEVSKSADVPFAVKNTTEGSKTCKVNFTDGEGVVSSLGFYDGEPYVNTSKIHYSGNKPTGLYTGTGVARTIATGGLGNTLMIFGGNHSVIVMPFGAIAVDALTGEITGISKAHCKFLGGILTMSADAEIVNNSGSNYTYQVL